MDTGSTYFDVLIIGGGLAGLSAALHIQKSGFSVLVIEKNSYPHHKVCGEYISNEVLPYLEFLGIDVFALGATKINRFEVSTTQSKLITSSLPLGGFGISRYSLDQALQRKAQDDGVKFLQDAVTHVELGTDGFSVKTKLEEIYQCKIVIGAYGKRSGMDVKLNRKFIKDKSPYLAVKTHVKGVFPDDLVALHNFQGGYCGVSKVEDDRINLCYITDFKNFKKYKDIDAFQEAVVLKNKYLKHIFQNSKPLFDAPLTISQISFDSKTPVEQHIIMCGDAAGMIHPLCGNGMSMAIRSAQIASELILEFLSGRMNRNELEKTYHKQWNRAFSYRLKMGHLVAGIFRNKTLSNASLMLLNHVPVLIPFVIRQTHGKKMIVR